MIGQVVKRTYKLYDEVGSGGFATVYLGRNLESNEIVAVKVLGEQFTREPRYVERFRREARLAERLRHPNIVRVLDHGIHHGKHFLVMEFVEGLTLDRIIERKGRLPVEEVLSYVEQACAGLQAAYEAGVVHRDIKPANIMITPGGTVKIMDFGIARVEALTALTQSGMFMGTPRYISPEVASGQEADIRSDLYGLGLLTYEMLTGAPPFEAANPWAVLRQQIEAQPLPLRQSRPDVPPWLEATVMQAMAKDPAKRFQTPAEMLAALIGRRVAAHKDPDVATPPRIVDPTSTGSARQERKRNRGLILGLAGTAVVVAVVLIALLISNMNSGRGRPTPTVEGVVQATSTLRPTDQVITRVVTNTPEEIVVSGGVDTPPPSPSPTRTPVALATMTATPATYDLTSPPATETPTPTRVPATDTAEPPTYTPTATTIPSPVPNAVATVKPPTVAPTRPRAPAVTGRIAFSVGGNLQVVDLQTKSTLYTISGMRQPDFRSDGAEILADGLGNPAAVVDINANTGAIIREQTKHTDDFHPFWSPDGARFAYDSVHHGLGQYTMLYTQGLTGSQPQPEVTLHFGGQQIRGHSPVWMHDDFIAFTGCDYWPEGTGGSKCGIYVMPSWSGRPTLIHPGSTNMRATDNHGDQVVLMSQETGDWEVFVMPNRGGTPRNLSRSPSSQDALGTFSPDGQRIAFASNRGGSWAIWAVNQDGSGVVKLFNLPGQPTSPWYEESISWGP
jgi:serine/threonine protein kinase/Tol biopolymer transport system component